MSLNPKIRELTPVFEIFHIFVSKSAENTQILTLVFLYATRCYNFNETDCISLFKYVHTCSIFFIFDMIS